MQSAPLTVMTVTGPIDPKAMGTTLPHEHVFSSFGEPLQERSTYDTGELLDTVLPYLARLRALGCATLVDCTARYFGRDPQLLAVLSEESGLQLLTNSGYYGAASDRYVPQHAYEESADRLAERWIAEWRDGIDGTGIRPGFLKIGVDPVSPLTEIDRKIVTAAARAHRETGLTIACHSPTNPEDAREALMILEEEGIAADAYIWVHAHTVEDSRFLLAAAHRGVWVELDGINADPRTQEKHVELVLAMKREELLGKVLLSHDGEIYAKGRPAPLRPCDLLFTAVIPQLRERGLTDAEIDLITKNNPQEAFAVRLRLRR